MKIWFNWETKYNIAKSILNYSNIIEGMVINYQNMKSEKEEIEEMVKSLARKKDVVE